MLQSRAFGSSSSSEDGRDDAEADSLINNETMANGTSYANGSYEEDRDAAPSGAQNATSANLASFEESFVPAEPPPAPLGNKPRPKTPAHKPRTASQATVRDAAGFVKQSGGAGNARQPFAREDALNDMSRATGGDETQNRTAADMTSLTGQAEDEGEPSFERSESQSMHVQAPLANVNTGRGKASTAARSSAGGSKQQLTLREQEKVRKRV